MHSVDRTRIAERLNEQRSNTLPPLKVLIQVNVDKEPQKSGVTMAELPALVDCVRSLPRLQLCGLMTILQESDVVAAQRASFAKLRHAAEAFHLSELSMGMSNDFPAAIAEGATIVRIGTAIFGVR